MLRLNERQRTLLAEKAFDSANLALGALVFGQFLGERISPLLAAFGLLVWVVFIAGAVWLMKENRT